MDREGLPDEMEAPATSGDMAVRPIAMRMPPERLVAPYATVVTILRSDRDIRLNFGQLVPGIDPEHKAVIFARGTVENVPAQAELVASVILVTQTAQELLQLLAGQLGFDVVQKVEGDDA